MFSTKRSTFETVVRAHAAALYRFAFWLCRDRQLASDLVQETLARGWRSWGSLRDLDRARVWLFAICRNEHVRVYRRDQARAEGELDIESVLVRAEASTSEIDVRRAIEAMPLTYREPLLLQVLGGFTCAEIAELLGATEGAIMTRLTRARQALRRHFDVAPEDLREVERR